MSGILTEVFSVEAVAEVVSLRTAGQVKEAQRVIREGRSAGREEEIKTEIGKRVKIEQYDAVFSVLWEIPPT